MKIHPMGSRPSSIRPNDYFTGRVRLDPVIDAAEPSRVNAGVVTFDAGARTHWHTHPYGQTLYVLSGLGWCQREGGPVEEIRPGDVVWFEPGERHWHGASATVAMSHLAIQESRDGSPVDWETPVTDAEYRRP